MGIGFHGASEGLLGNMRERVCIINDDPAMEPFFRGHLADKQTDLATDGLDASILFGSQKQTFVGALESPTTRMGTTLLGGIVLEKRTHENCFSTPRRTCKKQMTRSILLLKTGGPYGILTHQGRGGHVWKERERVHFR